MAVDPRRGEIWYVDLDPTEGSEMEKLRPCLVVNHDMLGRDLELRIIVPITGWQPEFSKQPFLIHANPDNINKLTKESAINVFQVRCTSLRRFTRHVGTCDSDLMIKVAKALVICIAYDYKSTSQPPKAP